MTKRQLITLGQSVRRISCDKDDGTLRTQPVAPAVGLPCEYRGYQPDRKYDNGQPRFGVTYGVVTEVRDDGCLVSAGGYVSTRPLPVACFRPPTLTECRIVHAIKRMEAGDFTPYHLCPSAKWLAGCRAVSIAGQIRRIKNGTEPVLITTDREAVYSSDEAQATK